MSTRQNGPRAPPLEPFLAPDLREPSQMLRADFAAHAAIVQPSGTEGPQYLTDYSPQDKPWDRHRARLRRR